MGGRGTSANQGRSGSSVALNNARVGAYAKIPAKKPAVNSQGAANFTQNKNGVTLATNGATQLSKMTDDQMEQIVRSSYKIDMPNQLQDVRDRTQRFVYAIGLNGKPEVMDDSEFNSYLKNNNIPKSAIISRSVSTPPPYSVNGITYQLTANDVTDMLKYSSLNYIGGKQGGKAYGAGAYFEQNGGRSTGYGSGATMIGVINRNKAKIITRSSLLTKVQAFQQSHPKTAAAIGPVSSRNYSIYALCMGYNVISSGKGTGTYFNVIDREALILRKSNLP